MLPSVNTAGGGRLKKQATNTISSKQETGTHPSTSTCMTSACAEDSLVKSPFHASCTSEKKAVAGWRQVHSAAAQLQDECFVNAGL